MATTQFTRTQTAGTSTKKFTVSMWFKPGIISTTRGLWGCGTGTGDGISLALRDDDTISFESWNGSVNPKQVPDRKFRDPAAWYHLVFSMDTTDVTGGDRSKIWINGVEIEDFSTDVNPVQDSVIPGWSGSGDTMKIGNRVLDGDAFDTGIMSHVHIIDGTIYAASAFGETDATSGIWVAKTSPSVTYGTNGGFYKFVSGALTTDSSGESNTLTQVGTPTTTKDSPDNNFATWNPLQNYYDPATFANGNTKFTTTGGTGIYTFRTSTIGMTSGKWYCEILRGGTADYATVGIASRFPEASDDWLGNSGAGNYGWQDWDGDVFSNNAEVADYTPYDGDVIVMIGLDLDNNKLYLGQNGVWENSADPGAGTGGLSITAPSDTFGGCYHFAAGDADNAFGHIFNGNFGNGYFGTTAVTSAVADGNGEGQFEYAPPTGFFALCTNYLGSES